MNNPTLQFSLKIFTLAALMSLHHSPLLGQEDTLVSFWQGSYTPTIIAPNITVTDLTEGPGITYYECAGWVAADGFDQATHPEGLANGDYWEFTLTPDPGYQIVYDWIEVQQRASMHPFSEMNTLGTIYWKIGNGPWTHSGITARVDPKPTNFCSSFASRRPHYPTFTSTQPITFRIVRYIYDNDNQGHNRVNRNGYLWVSGEISAPLPVEMTKFEASLNVKDVLLEWETASETENLGFEIERSSDGRSWDKIAFVDGNGTSAEGHSYTFTDDRPLPGHNYYRLKQIDFDQDFHYSDIKEVLFSTQQAELVQIYPNPSYDNFTISLSNPTRVGAFVKLVSSTGKVIWENQFQAGEMEAFWKKEFNLPQEGVYFIHTQIGKATETKKLVIIDQM